MGVFNDYMREGKGVSKGVDTRPRIVVFFDIYFRKFWKLIGINLLYVLCCIPIITIGPATAGITKILRNYAREEHAFILSDFWDTFKKNFKTAFVIGLLDVIIVCLILFDVNIYLQITGNASLRIIALAALLITATIFVFMNYYIFTLLITFKLTFKQLIKNAFIFAWIGIFRNILITAIIALITFLVIVYFMPLGFTALFLIYFSTCGLIINFGTYPLIKKTMIDGRDPETGEKLEQEEN